VTILIVDDEPLVRMSLRRALEKRGHTVFEAKDGVEGLTMWAEHRPDLVYLDVLMPRLSGPDLLKRMAAPERGNTKVILMSAYSGDYDLQKAKLLGADLFVAKPFESVFAVADLGEEIFRGK